MSRTLPVASRPEQTPGIDLARRTRQSADHIFQTRIGSILQPSRSEP
jgi:hypothetical protein